MKIQMRTRDGFPEIDHVQRMVVDLGADLVIEVIDLDGQAVTAYLKINGLEVRVRNGKVEISNIDIVEVSSPLTITGKTSGQPKHKED